MQTDFYAILPVVAAVEGGETTRLISGKYI